MRILHVTEAFGGGVLSMLELLLNEQTRSGHEVTLVHSIRPDTPDDTALDAILPREVKRITLNMRQGISPLHDLAALKFLLRFFRQQHHDVIHLHSSKAGFIGRLAAALTRYRHTCFYTPHGFAFLRKDVSPSKQKFFRTLEAIGARAGGTTLACSPSEMAHAKSLLQANRVACVENAVFTTRIQPVNYRTSGHCVVATSGRICPPKNPKAFLDLAIDLSTSDVLFLWIGGGELIDELKVDNEFPPNLRVTGWLDRREAEQKLHEADIFLMTSLWEGMPLALIEAQAAGLPAVVPDVEGCRDVVVDGVTGYICKNHQEMVSRLSMLVKDARLRRTLGEEARRRALVRFAPERMHQEVMQQYTLALTQSQPQ